MTAYEPPSMVGLNLPLWFDIPALMLIVVTMGVVVRYPTVYGFQLLHALFNRLLGKKRPGLSTAMAHTRKVSPTVSGSVGVGGGGGSGLGGLGGGRPRL